MNNRAHEFTATIFPNAGAASLKEYRWTLDTLAERIRSAKEYPSKAACPWIKLATFGDQRTDKNSLRHDANVLEVSGIEADYDGEVISLADAQILLSEQRITAILYTSPSHTEAKPRWRVLCPLSKPYPPSERARFVARLNGALGGILAPESFRLSQSYFVGKVMGAEFAVAKLQGEYIDLIPELDIKAISPPAPNGESRVARLHDLQSDDPVFARLNERKLLLRIRADGGADVICPFESDHTTPRAPGDCVYWPGHTGGFKHGHFKCMHSHCDSRPDSDFLHAIGIEELRDQRWSGADGRARAEYQPGEESTPAGEPARREWPDPLAEEAYCGLAGEIVRTIEPQTESDPAAILLQVLVAFGALVGRGPHFPIEGDQHHSNLFALIVGETSKARKGTSWGRVREIFSRAVDWPNVVDGLSTGEGLKFAVRDRVTKVERDDKGFAKEVETDPGVTDKRLLVVEAEFAQVLKQAPRAGNTLSATVRSAWDSGNLRTLTKNDPIIATGAHICIVGHITSNELRAELTATDSANGFANRFQFMAVKRSKALAFGGQPLAPDVVADFARRIAEAAGKARLLGAVTMTQTARAAWSAVYPRLSEGYPGLYGAVTARAEAQCLRLALTYALMCGETEIDIKHLLAALAVWERAAASARLIFGDALGDPVADQILNALRASRPHAITRTEISKILGRHQKAERIEVALSLLEKRGLARRESVRTGGAPAEQWTAV